MALGIARSYMRRVPANVCHDDLEQAALIGLMDGLRRHPEGEGPGFDCYLRLRIRGSIIDELRTEDWSPRRDRCSSAAAMVHLDDLDERWDEQMPGASSDPELAAIARIDGSKAWRTPLSPRSERILRAAYERGCQQQEIGIQEGISAARVSQLLTSAVGAMRLYLGGETAATARD
jgi:RNA polymerase sigma factor FliA